jgi:hypothetical protein
VASVDAAIASTPRHPVASALRAHRQVADAFVQLKTLLSVSDAEALALAAEVAAIKAEASPQRLAPRGDAPNGDDVASLPVPPGADDGDATALATAEPAPPSSGGVSALLLELTTELVNGTLAEYDLPLNMTDSAVVVELLQMLELPPPAELPTQVRAARRGCARSLPVRSVHKRPPCADARGVRLSATFKMMARALTGSPASRPPHPTPLAGRHRARLGGARAPLRSDRRARRRARALHVARARTALARGLARGRRGRDGGRQRAAARRAAQAARRPGAQARERARGGCAQRGLARARPARHRGDLVAGAVRRVAPRRAVVLLARDRERVCATRVAFCPRARCSRAPSVTVRLRATHARRHHDSPLDGDDGVAVDELLALAQLTRTQVCRAHSRTRARRHDNAPARPPL